MKNMLSDRDYMRDNNGRGGRGGPGRAPGASPTGMSAVMTLVLINVIVFVLENLNQGFLSRFALISPAVIKGGEYYRIVTYMFLHGGLMHIFFNMWGLYLFGSILENKIGAKSFFSMYFISGLIGGLLWILVNPNYPVPCIGASGSLFGVIIASAMFVPDAQFMLLIPPVPMKLKTLAIVYIVLELFMFEFSSGVKSIFSNIAHIVHLGGALGGYLYIKILFGKEIKWDIIPFGYTKKKSVFSPSSSAKPAGWSVSDSDVSQSELDRLLDKISEHGINSLSEDELAKLRHAREQMRR